MLHGYGYAPSRATDGAWVLLHVEIPGRGGRGDFSLRMHRYRCLLEGRYHRSVVGMAIIVQQIPAEQGQGEYHWEKYDCEVIYRYPVVKIYEGDDRALRESDNLFDLAHYAGMQAWKERGNDARKLDYMKILLAELNRRQWSHEEKMTLLWFIEGIMHMTRESTPSSGVKNPVAASSVTMPYGKSRNELVRSPGLYEGVSCKRGNPPPCATHQANEVPSLKIRRKGPFAEAHRARERGGGGKLCRHAGLRVDGCAPRYGGV